MGEVSYKIMMGLFGIVIVGRTILLVDSIGRHNGWFDSSQNTEISETKAQPTTSFNEASSPQENKISEVRATDLTGKHFPILGDMHAWLTGYTPTAYAFSPEDINMPAIKKAIETLRPLLRENPGNAEVEKYLNVPENRSAVLKEVASFLSGFISEDDFVQHMGNDAMLRLATEILSGAGGSYPNKNDPYYNREDIVLVVTPSLDMTKQEIASRISNLPVAALQNIPGNDADWRSRIIMQETVRARYNGLYDEEIEDLNAETICFAEWRKGKIVTKNLNDHLQKLRAINSVINLKATYATNAGIQSKGEGFPPKGPEEDFTNSLLFLHARMIEKIGGNFSDPHNAPLIYETVAQLYKSGALDKEPIAKQYAYEFLVAAAEYAPGHFRINDVADRNFNPPIFDRDGRYQPPEPARS